MEEREAESERYWDARARENALYYVDNRLDYRNPDSQAFWDGGDAGLDQILKMVEQPIGSTETVVDIGCGVGRMSRALAKRAGRVIAIDVSSEMLARGRGFNAHVENIDWVHGDGRSLKPIENASVDGCFSHVVFQHLPDPSLTLGYVREMGRVLRPGGWAVFQVSTNPAIHTPREGRRARLKRALRTGPRGLADPAWLGSAIDLEEMRDVATESGLAMEACAAPGTQFTIARLCRVA